MGDYIRRYWIPALMSRELPAPDCPPIRVRLLSEDLVAFRATDGRVGLVQANCPHRRAGLFWGRNEEDGLRCVYHGWKFDVNGLCVDMPSEPEDSNFKDKVHIKAYPTEDRGGVIWAYLGQTGKIPALPEMDWLNLAESHRYVTKRIENTNWVQALEGGIDSAHSNFLHSRLDAYRRDPQWMELARNASDMRTRYHALDRAPQFFATATNYGLRIGARRDAGDDGYYWRFTHWLTPFYNLFKAPSDIPGINGHGFAWVPIDDTHTWTITFTWSTVHSLTAADIQAAEDFAGPTIGTGYFPARNAGNDYLIDRDRQNTHSFTGIEGIQAQDMAVQESMGPVVDRTQEHLGTSDSAIIMVRRLLMQQAIAAAEGIEPYAAYHGEVYKTKFADTLVPKTAFFDNDAQQLLCALDEVNVQT